jgi:MSHA biogenesis protein MshJ
MNKQVAAFEQWIMKRDKREKIVLFILSLFVIYQVISIVFIHPVVLAAEALQVQINELKSKRQAINSQFDAITKIVQGPEFIKLLAQQEQLTQQRKNVKQKIENFKPLFVAESDYSKLTKDILAQLDRTIVLVSLKEFPDQPWSVPETAKSPILVQNINQHKLSIEFRANYFDTISYLSRLEKLPWHLYWDSLEYKVTKYPEADVVVQLYVLSSHKST